MIMRHSEKPDAKNAGVDEYGRHDKRSLSVRGWLRAGCWVNYFAPGESCVRDPRLAQPAVVYGSASTGAKGSFAKRCEQTVKPLCERLGIPMQASFCKGQEKEIAAAAREQNGPVLICWQHENIALIAAELLGTSKPIPAEWPEDRFDVVYVLSWNEDAKSYAFEQVPVPLLGGDPVNPIPT
jgi:hypothetical protein